MSPANEHEMITLSNSIISLTATSINYSKMQGTILPVPLSNTWSSLILDGLSASGFLKQERVLSIINVLLWTLAVPLSLSLSSQTIKDNGWKYSGSWGDRSASSSWKPSSSSSGVVPFPFLQSHHSTLQTIRARTCMVGLSIISQDIWYLFFIYLLLRYCNIFM